MRSLTPKMVFQIHSPFDKGEEHLKIVKLKQVIV